MHPAYSVILFTTASGAGYGLLVWLGLFGALGLIQADRWLGVAGFGIALGLITVGLLSSTFHLGHPERAWRALSQWRSSWLSREGVLAVATYAPAGLLALGWVVQQSAEGVWSVLAVLTALSALATIYCTGMIYASLRTVRHWHQPLVPYVYVVLGLGSGALVLNLLAISFGLAGNGLAWLCVALLLAGFALKHVYWTSVDTAEKTYTAGAATGLGDLGTVRPLEPAHTRPNFVMREMGFQIGRKHGRKLRRLANLLGFLVPIAFTLLTLLPGGAMGIAASALAVVSAALGLVIERWLFFAEAQHVVTVYYGADAA